MREMPEIQDLHDAPAPGAADEEVGRLEVAVDDSQVVRLFHRVRHLDDDVHGLGDGQRSRRQELVFQVVSLEVLEDDVGQPVRQVVDVDDASGIGWTEAAR